MGNTGTGASRLVGWKEIGQHLGVDARTAQRWERERGLPVERAEGEKGRVTADPEELDRWRHAGIGRPKPWANLRILQVYSVLTTALLILAGIAIGVASARFYVAGPPATFRVDGNVLRVLDRRGKLIWEHVFDNLPAPYLYAPDRLAENVAFADLDGNGRRELLFLYWHRDLDGPLSSTLLAFSDTGALRWQYTPTGEVADAKQTYPPNFVIDRFAFLQSRGGRGSLVIVTSHHSVSYPCQVVSLDRVGRPVGRYWHSGHLYHIGLMDLDGDGLAELLLGGVNVGYHQATLIALDPWHLAGGSNQLPGDPRQLQAAPRHTERAVLLFPRTELNERTEPFNFVMALWQEGDLIQTTVREKRGSESGYVSYTLDRQLRLRLMTPSDGLVKLYDQYRAAKQLSRDLLRDEVPRLQQITYLIPLQKVPHAQ